MESENAVEEGGKGEHFEDGSKDKHFVKADRTPKALETEVVHNEIAEEKASAKKHKKEDIKTVSLLKLFSYADSYDYFLMVIGTLGAFGHGLSFPMFFFFFGKLVDGFGSNKNNSKQTADDVGGYAVDLVYLGLIIWISAWAEVACWMHTGQRQASKMRYKYLEAILNQDIGFFDTDARTGMLVESISKDTVLVQDAISEKACSKSYLKTQRN